MAQTTYNGIQYATASDPAAIHTITQNLATTANSRLIGSFPDTASRDTAYSADIAAGKVGMKCWIVNRCGHCTYTGSSFGWKWDAVNYKVSGGIRSSAADSNSTTGGVVVAQPSVTLPPGNRLIQTTASGNVQNLTATAAVGRLYVIPWVSDGENWMEAALGGNQTATVSRTWFNVKSGTIQQQLYGLQSQPASGTGGVRFTNCWIQTMDLGPSDD